MVSLYNFNCQQLENLKAEDVIVPELLQILNAEDLSYEKLVPIIKEEAREVYSFPFLKPEFCALLTEEIESYEKEKKEGSLPNGLNREGWVLQEVGINLDLVLLPYINKLIDHLLSPKLQVDSNHSYIIRYRADGFKSLKFHTDDSDVTFNLCLKFEGKGNELVFGGHFSERPGTPTMEEAASSKGYGEYTHTVGRALLHSGWVYHAVKPLLEGVRWNFILWGMKHDEEWKRTFYEELKQSLREKSKKTFDSMKVGD
mmetsp:Transcript_51233/g.58719  ORF Transcript_51233/g.58719 Transcript_51233/m.58719 type:complete len:257 (+) Transcript_51233:51-821(+)